VIAVTETDLPLSWRSAPRSLVALMGIYESNYLRLAQLAGDLRRLPELSVSIVEHDCQLRLRVVERARYTTIVWLSYLLPGTGAAAADKLPDLTLTLYHDARMAEVGAVGGGGDRELRRCWQRNQMLNKWLEYCAERGHRLG
jgi:uncharacterized protein YqiB (DUF1249 family)